TYTQSGTAVCKITVATSDEWKDKKTGEKKEKTEWHRITAFGSQAETIGRYMQKGSQVYVEGKLQTSQYEKDGITRYSTDIIVNNFQFIGKKDNQLPQQGGYQGQQTGGFQQTPPNNHQQTLGGYSQGQQPDHNYVQNQSSGFHDQQEEPPF
ncbi:single-stranded DNA-binding protein, partial [Desulfobacterales bacterium HSG17]|nr:single-stranded DNA-binding protein [Desulfobacterales bacterium HSG17]